MALDQFLTWGSMWAVLQNGELDLTDLTAFPKTQVMEWANQAIRECEALIHQIYEDYFLKKTTTNLALVQNQDTIALPTDIYANKIRTILYVNGNIVYELHKHRQWHQFLQYRLARIMPTSTMRYHYMVTNQTPGQPAIVISPPAQESGQYLETWYLRRANTLTQDSDICDIPEFVQYVYDWIRVKVYERDGHFNLPKAGEDLKTTRELMVSTLTQMVPDPSSTEVEADISIYMEHS